MKEIYYITGISGHLGRNIALKLLSDNKQVVGLVFPGDKSIKPEDFPNSQNLTLKFGDVTNKNDVIEFLGQRISNTKRYLIHCAAIISIQKKYDPMVHHVNVDGVKNVVDCAILTGIDKLVYVSSVHAIPEGKKGTIIKEVSTFNPDDVEGAYAKSKAEANNYVLKMAREKKINATIVHPSGILGPNDYLLGHINELILQYLRHDLPAIVRGGYNVVDVRDVANGIIAAVEYGRNAECYILSGSYQSIKDIVNAASACTGFKQVKICIPHWIIHLVMPFITLHYKARHQKPIFTPYALSTILVNSNFTSQKAELELGFASRPFQETMQDTVSYLAKRYQIEFALKK